MDVAARLSVSEGTVSRWLSGERKPKLEMAVLLEREFGIAPGAWLFGRTRPS